MSLKQGPGTPIKDPVKLEILEDLRNNKPGAKERLYEYLIEDTKRTGTLYTPSYFKSLGIEESQAYRDAVDEYLKQKAIEYAEEQKAKKARRNKLLLVVGLIIIGLICAYIFTASAHSGRTDASGGHRDNQNASGLGSYHYHCGGYPAHLHTNGVCPYKSKRVSLSPSYITTYNDRYDEGYDEGYDDGYDEGYDDGKEIGHKIGYDTGHKKGYKEGDDYKSPHDIALMIYSPISIIAILALCIKAFKK